MIDATTLEQLIDLMRRLERTADTLPDVIDARAPVSVVEPDRSHLDTVFVPWCGVAFHSVLSDL